MIESQFHWINGQPVPTASGQFIDRHSPAHSRLLARFAAGSASEVDAAVAAAKTAFHRDDWATLPGSERAKRLNAWADLMVRDVELLARIEAEEVGKPIKFARGEVLWSVELTRYAASLAWHIGGEAFNHIGSNKLGLVTHEPIGVVGMIVPWNFPLVTLFQKLPYALAAGCAAVIKPSELTSSTALIVARLAKEAGIPDGLINIVTGTGPEVGEALIAHADVKLISFTGSTRVGKQIAQRAGQGLKRVGLELGGKAANVVFADADIDAAIDGILFGYTLNQGEECVAGTRLIIEASIADDFVKELAQRSGRLIVGQPLDEAVDMGAMIHEQQMNAVLQMIEVGRKEGARLVCGGQRLTDHGRAEGFFIAPTIFTEVTPTMRVFREEIFGPVLTVTTFTTAQEALTLANDTNYGLGNGVWTKDIDKALAFAQGLQSGTVFVNTFLETSVQLPFGGYKDSGMGRENGIEGLLEYMETKSTFIKMGERTPAFPRTKLN